MVVGVPAGPDIGGAVVFSAGGDAVVNPHELGVLAEGGVVARTMREAAAAPVNATLRARAAGP
jgi:hypothetical protein